ncbi:hypothetical protein [Chryseobacterium sp. c4a]|uniref:hypothetical protein n=1 Tax=Chryseobacterium sp. c4a TaxID=1573582 RepID=UPI001359F875|nr:hypothetical protein [Chryseobacterium sp. c4a]
MKTKIISAAIASLGWMGVCGQIGVNTPTPQTTMDISAKRDASGNITDNTQLIGLQAPHVTRAELSANTAPYGSGQEGALVYITDISGGNTNSPRTNITTIGYYYFDGTLWQKINMSASDNWRTMGNSGTQVGTNFIGTTDAQELMFKINNVQSGYMDYLNTKQNTAFGYNALVAGPAYNSANSVTTNNNNTAIGYEAMSSLGTVSGSFQTANVAVGAGAMKNLVGGAWNTAVGVNAMGSATGNPNTLSTMRNNTALGISALSQLNKGAFNIAIGPNAMSQSKTSAGTDVLSGNIAMGLTTLDLLNNGTDNIALGSYTGNGLKSGSQNVFIGVSAASNVTSGDHNIFIGHYATGTTPTSSGEINIGNIITGTGVTNNSAAAVTKKIGINTGSTLPNSTLQVGGSISLPIKAVTADYTITDTDYKILTRHTGVAEAALTLPDPATCAGRIYIIQNMEDNGGVKFNYDIEIGGGYVWTHGNAALKVKGVSISSNGTYYSVTGTSITLQSDGTEWTGITQ